MAEKTKTMGRFYYEAEVGDAYVLELYMPYRLEYLPRFYRIRLLKVPDGIGGMSRLAEDADESAKGRSSVRAKIPLARTIRPYIAGQKTRD